MMFLILQAPFIKTLTSLIVGGWEVASFIFERTLTPLSLYYLLIFTLSHSPFFIDLDKFHQPTPAIIPPPSPSYN